MEPRIEADPATVGALLRRGAAALAEISSSPRLHAELLLGAHTGASRARLMAFPETLVEAAAVHRFAASIELRRQGRPLAYLLGEREFYSLQLTVDAAVLVPRPETELLVEAALNRLPPAVPSRVLDLGTGSGALAIVLKQRRPALTLTGIDVSAEALHVARRNAERHGVVIRWLQSDWYGALAPNEHFDLIVCNPPYVASDDPHWPELRHEPRLALHGGLDGLDCVRAVLAGAGRRLAVGGALLLEHGQGQAEAIVSLAREQNLACREALRDLAGIQRALVLERA